MRKAIVAAVVALVVFAAGVAAQSDYIFTFRSAGYIDTEPAPHPCTAVGGLKGPVSMTVYDHNAWLVYTCQDDRVVLRRYLNPNDNAPAPIAVYQIPNPNPSVAALPVCPIGFVNTKGDGQGCVPPNHPLAR